MSHKTKFTGDMLVDFPSSAKLPEELRASIPDMMMLKIIHGDILGLIATVLDRHTELSRSYSYGFVRVASDYPFSFPIHNGEHLSFLRISDGDDRMVNRQKRMNYMFTFFNLDDSLTIHSNLPYTEVPGLMTSPIDLNPKLFNENLFFFEGAIAQ